MFIPCGLGELVFRSCGKKERIWLWTIFVSFDCFLAFSFFCSDSDFFNIAPKISLDFTLGPCVGLLMAVQYTISKYVDLANCTLKNTYTGLFCNLHLLTVLQAKKNDKNFTSVPDFTSRPYAGLLVVVLYMISN